jgi:hypothetical protein
MQGLRPTFARRTPDSYHRPYHRVILRSVYERRRRTRPTFRGAVKIGFLGGFSDNDCALCTGGLLRPVLVRIPREISLGMPFGQPRRLEPRADRSHHAPAERSAIALKDRIDKRGDFRVSGQLISERLMRSQKVRERIGGRDCPSSRRCGYTSNRPSGDPLSPWNLTFGRWCCYRLILDENSPRRCRTPIDTPR